MAQTINHITTLTTEECCTCGVLFGIPETLRRQLLATGATFYCPNGHGQVFTEPTEAKLKKLQAELDRQKIRLSQAEADARFQQQERQQTERRLSATRGALTKVKKRVANGVCPVCKRTFCALGRHVKQQHPGWEGEAGDA